ncbi:hypothetical protein BJX61DRAFT_285008 [Aspergillus egyptiacus]|nr:hypothetical protein BJX61DRAFT_285008 [Aspergillus egyptiacus]
MKMPRPGHLPRGYMLSNFRPLPSHRLRQGQSPNASGRVSGYTHHTGREDILTWGCIRPYSISGCATTEYLLLCLSATKIALSWASRTISHVRSRFGFVDRYSEVSRVCARHRPCQCRIRDTSYGGAPNLILLMPETINHGVRKSNTDPAGHSLAPRA